MKKYKAFTSIEAISFARTVPNLFLQDAILTSEEIDTGNSNVVFRIKDNDTGNSILFKQALPNVNVVDEPLQIPVEHTRIENDALSIQANYCPDLVPNVLYVDNDLSITVMGDYNDKIMMRTGLMSGGQYPLFPDHISTFLANTHFFTSDLGMNQQKKKKLQQSFVNPERCKITEELTFENPYYDAPENNIEAGLREAAQRIWKNTSLQYEVALLREGFLTHTQALLHGNLHTGNIFVTEETTKVIAPEFAFFGPIGFDIGAVFAHLLLNAAGQSHWSKTAEECVYAQEHIFAMIIEIWCGFEQQFRNLWNTRGVDRLSKTPGYQNDFMQRLLKDTFGYTGCNMLRHVIGMSEVADLETITNAKKRINAKHRALHTAEQLILHHRKATSIVDLILFARSAMGTTVNI